MGRLDGRPPTEPRGRYAAAHSADIEDGPREVVTIPMTQRPGYRTSEFARLCGVSVPTIRRQIRDGKIETVEIGGVSSFRDPSRSRTAYHHRRSF